MSAGNGNGSAGTTVIEEHAVHSLIRERYFSGPVDIPAVLRMLRDSGATGTLMLDIASGGVCAARFREERKLFPDSFTDASFQK